MKRRSNREGTIYQRKDGRWCGQVTKGIDRTSGKPIRKTVYGASQKEVAEKLLTERSEGVSPLTTVNNHTIKQAGVQWIEMLRNRLERSTLSRYELDLGYCYSSLGECALTDLTAWDVQRMYALVETQHSRDAARRAGTRLRQLLRHCIKLGLLRSSVAESVPLPRAPSKEMRPLTKEEAGRLLTEAASDRLAALYFLALDTGARQGELLALEWSDWSPSRRELRITKSLSDHKGTLTVKTTKTVGSRRTIRVGDKAAAALESHRSRMEAEGHGSLLVFCSTSGTHLRRPNFERRSWKPILKRAGLLAGFRFHDLRHTTATLLLQHGDNLRAIAGRLGHSSPETTLRIYSHLVPAMQEKTAALMDSIL